jgi:hypothetical protein
MFWLNFAYIAILCSLVLMGYFNAWFIAVALYLILFGGFFLAYWLPNFLRVRKLFGKPVPPIEPTRLVKLPMDEALAVLDNPGQTRVFEARSGLSYKLHETSIETSDGEWHYWIEFCGSKVVACDIQFNSSKSSFLNFSAGAQSGTAHFLERQ